MQGKPDYFEQRIYNMTLIERSNFRIRMQDIVVTKKQVKSTLLDNMDLEKNRNNTINEFSYFGTKEFLNLNIPDDNIKKNEVK